MTEEENQRQFDMIIQMKVVGSRYDLGDCHGECKEGMSVRSAGRFYRGYASTFYLLEEPHKIACVQNYEREAIEVTAAKALSIYRHRVTTDFMLVLCDGLVEYQRLKKGDIIKKAGGYYQIDNFSLSGYHRFHMNLVSLVSGNKESIPIATLPKVKVYDDPRVHRLVERKKQTREGVLSKLKDEIQKDKEANLMKPRIVIGVQNRYLAYRNGNENTIGEKENVKKEECEKE